MSRWFRFYDDVINDPKVLSLPEAMRWTWVAVLCAASKNDGNLPATDHLGLMLRVTKQRAAAIIVALHAAGLIDKTETGFAPHNWDGRQYKSDVSNERVKRYRERHRNVTEAVTVTAPETETETETEALPTVAERAGENCARSKSKKRAVALPADWQPSEKSYSLAEQFGQNVQIVEGIFRDYVASSGKLYADHDAAFHNFIRNQNSFNRGGANGVRQPENRGSIVNAADRAIAKLEREIAGDHQIRADAVLSLSQE